MFDVHATEEEDKLVLLSAIDRLGGCTEEQLMRFAVETGLMSQFPFSIALSGLKEAAFVRTSHRVDAAGGTPLPLHHHRGCLVSADLDHHHGDVHRLLPLRRLDGALPPPLGSYGAGKSIKEAPAHILRGLFLWVFG